MDPFAELDGVIGAWVKAANSTLFTEWAGEPVRCFHLPGTPPHECFQIVVFPPSAGRVTVQAAAIDANDDTEAEMLQVSEGAVTDLDTMLAAAVATIEGWKKRHERTRP